MNEDDVALLMTGSGEGVVRIYRNYESGEDVELVSSWSALTDLLPSRRSSGLVAEWQQGRGTMLVGGDVKVIRVWDAPREMCMSVSFSLDFLTYRDRIRLMNVLFNRIYPRVLDHVLPA